MLTAEQNRRITETGPGTPCGALMRRYWQPAALVEELDQPRPVTRVRLLGEDLVLFRDPVRPLRTARSALRPPRRRPGVRPLRGWRPALSLPWLAVRCHRRLPRTARRTRRQHVPPQGAPAGLPVHRTQRHHLGLHGPRRPAAIPRPRLLHRARLPRLRVQRPMVVQLAAGPGGRHRSRPRQLPAPLLRGRRPVLRSQLRSAIPSRDHRRRHPDDAADARSPQPAIGIRGNRRTACASPRSGRSTTPSSTCASPTWYSPMRS